MSWRESVAGGAGNTASTASLRALCLPEIVSVIVHELHSWSRDDLRNADYISRLDEPTSNNDDDARVASASAAHASLRAAALVNRTWCAAALSLLWQCPSEHALDVGAVPEPERRAAYAKLIREVHIYWRSPLWRALAEVHDVADDDSPGATDGGDNGGSVVTGQLSLPRLKVLCVAHHSRLPVRVNVRKRYTRYQLPLEPFISKNLEHLSCYVTVTALNRLIEMLNDTMPRQAVRLRILELCGHVENTVADKGAMKRLFVLLAREPEVAPALSSVRLHGLNAASMSVLPSFAFRELSMRPGLKQLWLEDGAVQHIVGEGTVESVAALLPNSGSGSSGNANSSSASHGHRHNLYQQAQQHGHRPFQDVQDLRILVDADAMPPLVPLLTSVTTLLVDARNDGFAHDAADLIFSALPALHQLRHLEVSLPDGASMAGAHLRALHRLTRLLELAIIADASPTIDDADVGALLRALSSLQVLGLKLRLPRLSRGVLWVIAVAGKRLQRLTLYERQDLSLVLENATVTPLFPHLTCLDLGGFVSEAELSGSDIQLKAEAKRQVSLLHLHAPKLYAFSIEGRLSTFDDHVERLF